MPRASHAMEIGNQNFDSLIAQGGPTADILDLALNGGLGRGSEIRDLAEGATIEMEGERNDDLLILLEGVVSLSKSIKGERRQIIGFRFPGQLIALHLPDSPWTVDVQAITAGKVCRLSAKDLFAAAKRNPALHRSLMNLAIDEIASAEQLILALGQKTTAERVAAFLLELSRQTDTQKEVWIPMSRTAIADYLGMTTETVCRVLTRLRTKGIVAIPKRNMAVLLDRQALDDIAAGRRALRA